MHLPVGLQHLCVCSSEIVLKDFYAAENEIFTNFGIKINLRSVSYDSCLNLLELDSDHSFCILLHCDSPNLNFRSRTLYDFTELINKSQNNHKIGLISSSSSPDDESLFRQIYFNLLSSLNLTIVRSIDGFIDTIGIQMEPTATSGNDIKSTLINLIPDNLQISRLVQVVNVQPIILDMTRCGILEPIFYFIARDFGTCIGKVLLPNETEWSLAYLIQCDDSGRNDLDMVKVCLVNNDHDHDNDHDNDNDKEDLFTPYEPSPVVNLPSNSRANSKIEEIEISILNNSNYPLCKSISTLLGNLKRKEHKHFDDLIRKIKIVINYSKVNGLETFPGIQFENVFQIKKMYLKLFKEIVSPLVDVKDKRQKQLVAIIKEVRRCFNFLGKDINDAIKRNPDLKILVNSSPSPTKTKTKNSNEIKSLDDVDLTSSKWFMEAKSLAYPERRYRDDVQSAKKLRLHSENQDGILTMPLLEPYLEIKWPTRVVSVTSTTFSSDSDSDEVLKEYTQQMNERENYLLANKRFGI